jgi:hypothetical protein
MDTFRYLSHSYGYDDVGKPSLFNLTAWLENVRRAPLKPDVEFYNIKYNSFKISLRNAV